MRPPGSGQVARWNLPRIVPNRRPWTRASSGVEALIFWDPKSPVPKKLDAIDTDQITPATDCVSESLETLDERWKAGSFRYLMPDFRERVHRGETFVIAGDRFAIGSSREMSPAGLKGVAEEAGLQLVVVCGHNMGDIFRRNAFNLGLHVVQSPEAVADAKDGDELTFDPSTRQLTNVTQDKTYEPVPLSPKEEEIRRGGGIFAVGRRELRRAVETAPAIDWPDEAAARRMTTTEQIIWAHRVDKDLKPEDLKPGTTLRVYADLLPASDGTAPFAIHTFNQITGGAIYPRQAAIANDHFVFTGNAIDDKQTSIGREFARQQGLEKPVLRHPWRRHLPFLFSRTGARDARPVHPGRRLAQPRIRRIRRGRHWRRIDDARVRVGDGIHLFHAGESAARDVSRPPAALGERQGHRAGAAPPVGGRTVAGDVGGARRRGSTAPHRVPQHDRKHDGRGGSAERHLRARRDHRRVVHAERDHPAAVSACQPGRRGVLRRSTKRSASRTSFP